MIVAPSVEPPDLYYATKLCMCPSPQVVTLQSVPEAMEESGVSRFTEYGG